MCTNERVGPVRRKRFLLVLIASAALARAVMGCGGPSVSNAPPPSCANQPMNPYCVDAGSDASADAATD
jgi:hypothetical protein